VRPAGALTDWRRGDGDTVLPLARERSGRLHRDSRGQWSTCPIQRSPWWASNPRDAWRAQMDSTIAAFLRTVRPSHWTIVPVGRLWPTRAETVQVTVLRCRFTSSLVMHDSTRRTSAPAPSWPAVVDTATRRSVAAATDRRDGGAGNGRGIGCATTRAARPSAQSTMTSRRAIGSPMPRASPNGIRRCVLLDSHGVPAPGPPETRAGRSGPRHA
jgi:hypothetical protein